MQENKNSRQFTLDVPYARGLAIRHRAVIDFHIAAEEHSPAKKRPSGDALQAAKTSHIILMSHDASSHCVKMRTIEWCAPLQVRYPYARYSKPYSCVAALDASSLASPASQLGGLDNLYCRYALSFGNDWDIVHVSHAAAACCRVDATETFH